MSLKFHTNLNWRDVLTIIGVTFLLSVVFVAILMIVHGAFVLWRRITAALDRAYDRLTMRKK